jgi:hypothetical protein
VGYFYEGGGPTVPGPGSGGVGDDVSWLLQKLRLDVLPGQGRDLSFHLSLTARNQVNTQSLGDTRTRVYHAYLRYRPRPGLELRLGRHLAYAGVATGVLDGVSLGYRWRRRAELKLTAGTLGMESREALRLDKPEDSKRWGGMLKLYAPPFRGLRVSGAVSFAQTWRQDQEDTRRLGVHALARFRREWTGRFEWRRDLLLSRDVSTRVGLEYRCTRKPLRVWAEYARRRPDLRAGSFFSVFGTSSRDEIRGGFTLPVLEDLRLKADAARIAFEDDKTTRHLQLMLDREWIHVGWRIQRGYGGNQNGLVAGFRCQVRDILAVFGDVDLLRYHYGFGVGEQESGASLLAAGVEFRPGPWTLRLRGELMDHPAASSDYRALGELTYRFGWGF